jgi:ABC-type polysaccharide/polyol phosphate export permease
MREDLKELLKYRELLYMFTYRDIRVRYKQSIMGFLWAILMPILIVGAGVVIRYAYAMASGKHFAVGDIASVAVKSVPWAFFVASIRFSCICLVNNPNLVTKVYFPKEVFPISSVMACFFDFLIATGALLILLFAIQVGWTIQLLWVPLLLLGIIALTLGIAVIISAASLYFRDVKYIVEVIVTFGIFFTPVLFDPSMLGAKGKWLEINPIAPLLEDLSACIVYHRAPEPAWLIYSLAFSLITLCGGYIFFKLVEPGFAESI